MREGLGARVGPYRPQDVELVAAPAAQRHRRRSPAAPPGKAAIPAPREIELHQVNDEWRVVGFRFN